MSIPEVARSITSTFSGAERLLILRLKDLEAEFERGITVGTAGAVLDGYLAPESSAEAITLTGARLLDAETRPSRGIPSPVIPTRSILWWSEGTAFRHSKAKIIFDNRSDSIDPIPVGKPISIMLPGLVVTGELRELRSDDDSGDGFGSAEDLNITEEELAELRLLNKRDIESTYIMIINATVIMGTSRIPTGEPKGTWILKRKTIIGWMPFPITIS